MKILKRLRALWRALRNPPPAAPLPMHPPGVGPIKHDQPRLPSGLASAIAAALKAPVTGNPQAPSVFGLPSHPPSVWGGGSKQPMAMDSAIATVNTWANGIMTPYGGQENVTFLGYAYLAELAQRPEYRVIVETIATEMTREWIEFVATEDKTERIKQLDEQFKKLNVQGAFANALAGDGYFGRGHIYIDTGDTDNPGELLTPIGDGWNEISAQKISQTHPVTALRPVEAVWCYPTGYNSNDPLKPDWYKPDVWYVQAKQLHKSRLVTLIGREVPDLLKPTYSFGGLSLSQMAKPYVDNWLTTRQGVNDIVQAFSVFVLATDLQTLAQANGEDLIARADLFNLLRQTRGLMMVNKESEDFKNVAAPLGGLDMLQAQAQEHMASVSHIPTVKLLGIQPAGLNASSEDQMRVFYDWIHACQEAQVRHPLHVIMGLIMLSLWGEVDPAIGFVFKPLFSMSEKEAAEVNKIEAETDQIRIDSGVIDAEEARERVANDPDSGYSNIDPEKMPEPRNDGEGDEGEGGEKEPFKEAAE